MRSRAPWFHRHRIRAAWLAYVLLGLFASRSYAQVCDTSSGSVACDYCAANYCGTYDPLPDESGWPGAPDPDWSDPYPVKAYTVTNDTGSKRGSRIAQSLRITFSKENTPNITGPIDGAAKGDAYADNYTPTDPITENVELKSYDQSRLAVKNRPQCGLSMTCTLPPIEAMPQSTTGTEETVPPTPGKGTDPVNAENGELIVTATDLELPGFGVPFKHTRTYRSRVEFSSPIGYGWDHGYNQRVFYVPSSEDEGPCSRGKMIYSPGTASTITFTFTTAAPAVADPDLVSAYSGTALVSATAEWVTYLAPPGVHLDMVEHVTTITIPSMRDSIVTHRWMITSPDGITRYFNDDGLLISIKDPNSNGLTMTWEPSARRDTWRLATVRDSLDRSIVYSYTADGHLDAVTETQSGLRAAYTYSGENLASATNAQGRTELYAYDAHAHPSELTDFIPEPLVERTCRNLCTSSSSCEGGGVCDGVVSQCKAKCQSCLPNCTDACHNYCEKQNCEPQCRGSCTRSSECSEEAIQAICVAAYDGLGGSSTGSTTPRHDCADCSDGFMRTCKLMCNSLLGCAIQGSYGASAGTPGYAIAVGVCVGVDLFANADSVGQFFEQLFIKDLGNLLFLGAATIADTIACGASVIKKVFCLWSDSCETDCEFDRFKKYFYKACNNACVTCPAWGEHCSADSCVRNEFGNPMGCGEACMHTFFEETTGSTCVDTIKEGCPTNVRRQCNNQCTSGCVTKCAGDCNVSCEGACARGCDVPACEAMCEIDYRASCEDGCFAGCVDELRVKSGQKYGKAQDLNHNLISVSYLSESGAPVEYLRNTYNENVLDVAFDRVVAQQNGDRPITLHYRDLEAEALGFVAPPVSGPTKDYVESKETFDTVDVCPRPCPSNKTVSQLTDFVPWGYNVLVGMGGSSIPASRTLSSWEYSSPPKVPPTLLTFSRSLSGVTVGLVGDMTYLRPFTLRLTSGTAQFSIAGYTIPGSGYLVVSGTTAVLEDLLTIGKVTLQTDPLNYFRAYRGKPSSLLHVSSGKCFLPFSAVRNSAGQIEVSAQMCSGDLVLSPMATAIAETDPVLGQLASNPNAFGSLDLFAGTVLVPGRYAVTLRQVPTVYRRYEMSVGPLRGAASTSLATAVYDSFFASKMLQRPPDPTKRPIYTFHLPAPLRRNVSPVPVYDVGSAFDPYAQDASCDWGIPDAPRRGAGSLAPGVKAARTTVVVDPYGATWVHYFDRNGRELQVANITEGTFRSFNYDPFGNQVAVENPLGDRVCRTFDESGNVREEMVLPAPGTVGTVSPLRRRFDYSRFPSRLTNVYDPRDPTLVLESLSWDEQGNLLSETLSTGGARNETTTYTPGPYGLPVRIKGPSGAETSISYNRVGSSLTLRVTQDALGLDPLTRETTLDVAGRPASMRTPLGENLSWTWNGGQLGSLTSTADGKVDTTSYQYNKDGAVRWLQRGLMARSFSYDKYGNVRSTTRSAVDGSLPASSTCNLYGPEGRLLETVLPQGNRVRYEYDGEGRLKTMTRGWWVPDGTGWDSTCPSRFVGYQKEGDVPGVTSITYDANGNPRAITDEAGITETRTYDGFGRLVMRMGPDNTSERLGYDALGNVIWRAVYSAAGKDVPYGWPLSSQGLVYAEELLYDRAGRVSQKNLWRISDTGTRLGYQITRYTYDTWNGNLTVTDDAGGVTTIHTDGAGRPTLVTVPTGDTVAYTHNTAARRIQRTTRAPTPTRNLVEVLRVSSRGQLERIDHPSASAPHSAWEYDELGRVTRFTDAAGLVEATLYDAFDRPKAKTSQYGNGSLASFSYDWDHSDALLAIRSEAGHVESYQRDALNRVRIWYDSSRRYGGVDYYGGSYLPSVAWDTERHRDFYYTPTGQVDTLQFGYGSTLGTDITQQRKYTYDALGRLVQARHSGLSLTDPLDDLVTDLRWDSLGNKTLERDSVTGDAGRVVHEVDDLGHVTASTIGTVAVKRTYDLLGRQRDVYVGSDATPTVHFDYDGLGGPIARKYLSGLKASYSYDALNRLVGIAEQTAQGAAVATWRWEIPLDGVPRVAGLRRGTSAERAGVYLPDQGRRIGKEDRGVTGATNVDLGAFDLSSTANTAVSGFVGTGVDAASYTLDGRHNWKTRTSTTRPWVGTTSVNELNAYTSFGGVTPVYSNTGNLLNLGDEWYSYDEAGDLVGITKGSVSREYAYDALGRRVKETDGTGQVTQYAFDGLRRTVRVPPAGAAEVMVDGAGLDEHLVRVNTDGSRLYYHQDRQNNVYLVTDAGGLPREWYEYTAYGDLRILDSNGWARTSSAVGNRFGYQGQPFDLGVGLVDMRARFYRPAWGRFLNPDPIGYSGGSNLYAFVSGATLSYWDPLGLDQRGIGNPGDALSWVPLAGPTRDAQAYADKAVDSCMDGESYECVHDALMAFSNTTFATIDVFTLGLASVVTNLVRAEARNTVRVLAQEAAAIKTAQQAGNAGDVAPINSAAHEAPTGASGTPSPASAGGGGTPSPAAEGAALRPYSGPGGGHHVPAKSAFAGAPSYNPNAALAIPNAELARLGVSHSAVTGAQMTGYRAFARTGAPLTWEAVSAIETNALIRGGMAPDVAGATVTSAIYALKAAGVAGPTRIPWGP